MPDLPQTMHYSNPSNSFNSKYMFFKILQNLQENICARVSFVIKLQTACNPIKKGNWHRCFPVNQAEFLRRPFFNRTPPNNCFSTVIVHSLYFHAKQNVSIIKQIFIDQKLTGENAKMTGRNRQLFAALDLTSPNGKVL